MRKIYIAFEIQIPNWLDIDELEYINELAQQLKRKFEMTSIFSDYWITIGSLFTGKWEYIEEPK